MNLFGLLLKKELRGFKSYKKNYLGTIVSVITVLAIMAAFVYLFVGLNSRFVPLGISNEILSLFIFAILIISVVFSLNKAAVTMFSVKDANILRPLPLNPQIVVLSKMVALFINELITVAVFALPIFISFGIIGSLGVWYYIKAVACVIIIALATTAIAALIAPLFNIVKNFLLNNGLLFFVVSLVFIGLLFFGYKYILDIIIGLISNRRLQFFFNSSVVNSIRKLAGCLLFSSSLGMFLGGVNFWRVIVCFVIVAGIAVGSFFLCAKLYNRVGKTRSVQAKEGHNKHRTVVGALIFKELNELVRTPGYMFSYLSIALSLPALTYLTMEVLKEVVSQLLTASLIAPFAMLILVLYSTVSNTFAGDAVSREGNKLSIVKTIPVSLKLQIGVKLLLSLAIACFAITVSVVLMIVSGTVGMQEGLIIFAIALLSTAATIISMINNDIKGTDSEKNAATSVIKSFIYSIFIGILASIFCLAFGGLMTYAMPLLFSVLYFVMAIYNYFRNLDRRIKLL